MADALADAMVAGWFTGAGAMLDRSGLETGTATTDILPAFRPFQTGDALLPGGAFQVNLPWDAPIRFPPSPEPPRMARVQFAPPTLPPHPFGPPAPPPEPPDLTGIGDGGEGGEPIIRYPMIEEAARSLAERRVVLPDEMRQLDAQARKNAFTISHVWSEESLERIRDLLTQDVATGGTLKQFRDAVEDTLGRGYLSRAVIEATYRTRVGAAQVEGQERILDDPMVVDEFPFMAREYIHDERVTDLCLTASQSGMEGTNIFLRDDPEWLRIRPLAHYNCRCVGIALSIKDAAERGLRYAKQWLQTGRQPPGGWVQKIDVELPPGWVPGGGGVAG